MIVTIQHLRTVPTWTSRIGFCAPKGREFFKRYNLSWSDFVINGIDSDKLLATGNALAIHLVEHAMKQEASKSKEEIAQLVEEFKDGQ